MWWRKAGLSALIFGSSRDLGEVVVDGSEVGRWQSPNKPISFLFPVMRDAMLGVVFWEGHVVDSSQERADGSLLLYLSDDPSHRPRCGHCGSDCVLLHERRRRLVRDRDWFDRCVWLDVPIRRLDCYQCGARAAERLSWLDSGERITHRLRAWVEALVQILPIAHCTGTPSSASTIGVCRHGTVFSMRRACIGW